MLRRERVAYMGYGGLLMLGYQKSSAAAPHARNALGIRYIGFAVLTDERSNIGRRLRGGARGR